MGNSVFIHFLNVS